MVVPITTFRGGRSWRGFSPASAWGGSALDDSIPVAAMEINVRDKIFRKQIMTEVSDCCDKASHDVRTLTCETCAAGLRRRDRPSQVSPEQARAASESVKCKPIFDDDRMTAPSEIHVRKAQCPQAVSACGNTD
jgi:hypothetical protein